jgi:hypothetical protein
MAHAYDLERADTACPGGQNDKRKREIERRRRNTVMGSGAGSDFVDASLVPVTLGATKIPKEDVTHILRYIRNISTSQDERIELLTIILGE